MANVEKYDDLIIGSGIAGKFTAWTRDSCRRTVILERGLPRCKLRCSATFLKGVARRNSDASDDVRRTGSITGKRSAAMKRP